MSAQAVGSTQLLVPGVQLQPRNASFCRTTFGFANHLCIHCRHRLLSPGISLQSHSEAPATASGDSPYSCKARAANEVTQDPSENLAKAGHEWSGNCVARSHSLP